MNRWHKKFFFKTICYILILSILNLSFEPYFPFINVYAQNTENNEISQENKQQDIQKDPLLKKLLLAINELKEKDKNIRREFDIIEKKISSLSQKIQERHIQFVQNYNEKYNKLLYEIGSVKNNKYIDKNEIISCLKKIRNFIKEKPKIFHTDNLSHRSLSDTITSPGVINTPLLPPGINISEPQQQDISETIETEITPEIKRYAEMLSYDPIKIYEFVKNNIDYEPYFGAVKTAEQTLLDRRGNDIDIASLLIALFRASNIPARYVYGKAEIPIDKAANWVGTTDPNLTVGNFIKNGIPATSGTSGGAYSVVTIDHVWVKAYIPYIPSKGTNKKDKPIWIELDPSFKQHIWKEGRNLAIEIGVDPITFLSQIKSSSIINEEESYATGEPQDFIIDKIFDWCEDIKNYASANSLTIDNLYRKKEIKKEIFGVLPVTLPYNSIPEREYSSIPDELKHHLKIILLSQDGITPVIEYTISLPELSKKRITLSYIPETDDDRDALSLYSNEKEIPCYLIYLLPEIRIDGQPIVRLHNSPITMGSSQILYLEFITPTTGIDRIKNEITAGSYSAYCIDPIFISENTLYKNLERLRFIHEKISKNDISLTKDDLIGEVLHTIGISYFYQLDRLNLITGGCLSVNATRQPSEISVIYDLSVEEISGVPYKAKANKIVVDVDRDIITPISSTGDAIKEKQFMASSGLTASALEHAILEQVLSGDAISTLRAIEIANIEKIPVYKITNTNLETIISNLSSEVREIAEEDIRNATNAGQIVTIPKSAISYAGWKGVGYIILDPDTNSASYLLSGNISGGIRPSDFFTPSNLILQAGIEKYIPFIEQTTSWLNVSEDWTENITWSYIPAITSINEWFKDARNLDLATTIASTIAVSGPISKISSQITIYDISVIPSIFSPNNDGILDTTIISANLTKSCNWSITLKNDIGNEIRTWSGTGNSISVIWDGKDSSGNIVPSGIYKYTISATDPVKGISTFSDEEEIIVDVTLPVSQITKPKEGQTLTGAVIIEGNISDEHFSSYTLEYCKNGSYIKIISVNSPVSGPICTWDTRKIESGSYVLKLTVKDTAGNTSISTINIILFNDTTAPVVTITSQTSGQILSGIVTISASATDDTGVTKIEIYINDSLKASKNNSTISYIWDTTTQSNGTYKIKVKAYDSSGNIGQAEVSVIVSNIISNVNVVPNPFSPNNDGYQDTTTISATLSSSMDWSIVIKDTTDKTIRTFSGTGNSISVIWDGKDSSGTVVSDGTYITTIIADTSSVTFNIYVQVVNNSPIVEIKSPKDKQIVKGMVDIIGSAYDVVNIDFDSWELIYISQTGGSGKIAEGNFQIINTKLATWDTSLLKNGFYTITLIARDKSGNENTYSVDIQLVGELKIGNFRITEQDISIPISGIPITISRTFDTIWKDESEDFGYGWKMDIASVELVEDDYHNVFITLPDGRRTVFVFTPRFPYPFYPQYCRASYTPAEPGVYDKLEQLDYNSDLIYLDGEYYDFGMEVYNPANYRLTTKDGTVYNITQDKSEIGKLVNIIDRNNNALTFTSAGITHSSGKGIIFERDTSGKIISIIDPEGDKVVEYTYDTNGDLVKVTRLIDKETNKKVTTTYEYIDHKISKITDPRGITPVINEYDPKTGRIISHTDAYGNKITYQHNLDTKQEIIADRNGNITIYEYNNDGLVVNITDALGNTTTYQYDSNKNRIAETNPLGETTRYTYDSKGNMTSITDPLGNTTYYTYNSYGQVLTTTDPLGHTTANEYDERGNRIKTIDALGNVTTYEYDKNGNLIATTDPLGTRTENKYNQFGYIIETKIYSPEGKVISQTTYTYDELGNQITSTTYRTVNGTKEAIITTNIYDKQNRIIKTIDPYGNYTETIYNEIGKQIATRDKNGNITNYEYDLMGNLKKIIYPDGTTEEYTYDKNGNRLTTKDRNGNITKYEYDALNRLVKTIYSDGSFTTNTYDSAGRLISTTDANGNTTTYRYDSAGRKIAVIDALGNETTYNYDSAGNLISITDANGNKTEYKYDALNRQVRIIYPDGTQITTEYDALGRKIMTSDQAQIVTYFKYDCLGKLIEVINAAGTEDEIKTTYTYDEIGNRITQKDANGHTTRFEYDKLGRLTKKILPLGQYETYSYDANGNMIRKTDFNGNTITYQYDTNNRLIKKTYPDGTFISFTYTPSGKVSSMKDSIGTTVYQYDNRGRLTREIKAGGEILEYEYDRNGNQVGSIVKGSGGNIVQYVRKVYDVLNRLVEVEDERGKTRYSYDSVGNRKRVEYPNGTVTEYTYDRLNRLTYLENKRTTGEIISSFAYTLGPAGNRIAVEEADGSRVEYRYDSLYRLIRETRTGTYPYTIFYTYDAVGNRLSQTKDGIITTYTYDANDRLIQEIGPQGTTTYTYDNNGNTTRKTGPTETANYTYDYENRLIAGVVNGQRVDYTYDGKGNRVSKTDTAGTTRYIVDTNNNTGYSQVVLETDGIGDIVVGYVYGDDLISQNRSGSVFYYHYDGLGSTRNLTNSSGISTDSYWYYGFGDLLNKTGTTLNNYLFTGEQYDPNVGFYYLRARYYNPTLGRFLTTDPVAGSIYEPVSLHKYLYCANDPINKIDSSGEYFAIAGVTFIVFIVTVLITVVGVIYHRSLPFLNSLSYENLSSRTNPTRRTVDRCISNLKFGEVGFPEAKKFFDDTVNPLSGNAIGSMRFVQVPAYFFAAVHRLTPNTVYIAQEWWEPSFTDLQRTLVILHELSHLDGAGESEGIAWQVTYEAELRYRYAMNIHPLPLPPAQPSVFIFTEAHYDTISHYLPLETIRRMVCDINNGSLLHFNLQ